MTHIQHHSGHRRAGSLTRQQGFSLLESLIAILIFAIGILGLIGLQTAATTTQTETRSRSEAASLAQEMLALMWTDMDRIDQYMVSSDDSCVATACQRWLNKLRATLPNGSARTTTTAIQDANNNPIGSDVDLILTWQTPSGDQRRLQTATSIIRGTVQ